jgi:hypothetical protein
MARYFFHVHDSVQIIDKYGTELPHIDAARRHAVAYASKLLADNPEQIWMGEKWSMEITNREGLLFFRIDIETKQAQHVYS